MVKGEKEMTPTPEGELTTSAIWTSQEPVQEVVPVEEVVETPTLEEFTDKDEL
jgi:hypothetical protein